MKKVLLGLVALSAVSFAAQGDMFLNARVGVDLGAKYDSISYNSVDILDDETDGFGGEIALEGYKSLTDNFDLGLGLAYQKHIDREGQSIENSGIKGSGVEYNSIPMYLTGRYTMDTDSQYKPYLKANLGYSFNLNSSDAEGSNGFKTETKIKDGLYWALGGGVEYNNFTVDLMYAVTKAKVEADEYDVKEDNNYGRFVLSAGYRFDL